MLFVFSLSPEGNGNVFVFEGHASGGVGGLSPDGADSRSFSPPDSLSISTRGASSAAGASSSSSSTSSTGLSWLMNVTPYLSVVQSHGIGVSNPMFLYQSPCSAAEQSEQCCASARANARRPSTQSWEMYMLYALLKHRALCLSKSSM